MAIAKKLWRIRNRGVASPWRKKSRPRFIEEKKTYADCMTPVIGDALKGIEMQDRSIPEGSLIIKFSHNLNRANWVIAGFLKVKLKGKPVIWLKSPFLSSKRKSASR